MKYLIFTFTLIFAFAGTEADAQHYRDDAKISKREQRFFNRLFEGGHKEVRKKEKEQRKLRKRLAKEERKRQKEFAREVRKKKSSWGTAEGRRYHGQHTGPFAGVTAWFSRTFSNEQEYSYQ